MQMMAEHTTEYIAEGSWCKAQCACKCNSHTTVNWLAVTPKCCFMVTYAQGYIAQCRAAACTHLDATWQTAAALTQDPAR